MRTHVCPWWLAYSFDNRLRRHLHDPERLLAPFVQRGMTTLDVGCAWGTSPSGWRGSSETRGP
jgi:hypothetical protein